MTKPEPRTPEEIELGTILDPDNPPLTGEKLAEMKLVAIKLIDEAEKRERVALCFWRTAIKARKRERRIRQIGLNAVERAL